MAGGATRTYGSTTGMLTRSLDVWSDRNPIRKPTPPSSEELTDGYGANAGARSRMSGLPTRNGDLVVYEAFEFERLQELNALCPSRIRVSGLMTHDVRVQPTMPRRRVVDPQMGSGGSC